MFFDDQYTHIDSGSVMFNADPCKYAILFLFINMIHICVCTMFIHIHHICFFPMFTNVHLCFYPTVNAYGILILTMVSIHVKLCLGHGSNIINPYGFAPVIPTRYTYIWLCFFVELQGWTSLLSLYIYICFGAVLPSYSCIFSHISLMPSFLSLHAQLGSVMIFNKPQLTWRVWLV